MKSKHRTTLHLAAFTGLALFSAATTLQAQTAWDGGPDGTGTDYATAVNWAGDVIPGDGNSNGALIGNTGTNQSVIYSTATSYTSTGTGKANSLLVGTGTSGVGSLTLSGSAGTLTFGGNGYNNAAWIGTANNNTDLSGSVTVSAGKLAITAGTDASINLGVALAGTNTGTKSGTLLINGGAVEVGRRILMGANRDTTIGNLTISSGTLDMKRTGLATEGDLGMVRLGIGTNTVNLDGGTVIFSGFRVTEASNARSTIYMNGTTLKANATIADLFNGTTTNANYRIKDGGLILDTNGFNVTINDTLTQETGHTAFMRKEGTGTLTLSGSGASVSGTTTVSGGGLILNAPLGGNVEVGADVTLGGTGSSAGSLTTAATASLLLPGGLTTAATSFDAVTLGAPTYVEFASSPVDSTVYDVITYGAGGLTGYADLVPLARGTLADDTANNKVIFTAGAPGTRTWNTGDGVWDRFGILTNWAGGDLKYYQGDDVVFGPIGSDTEITLDGLLAPSSVKVENTAHAYTFAGTGGLTGSANFEKLEDGTLVIANPNPSFTGITSIQGGVLRIADGGSWGSGGITNNATLEVDRSTNLTLPNTITGTGSLVKTGTGTLTLSNIGSTFSGNVSVTGGTLSLATGNNTSSPVNTVIGNPAVARNITVESGAVLQFAANDVLGNAAALPAVTLIANGGTITSNGTKFSTLGAIQLNGGTLSANNGVTANFQTWSLTDTVTVGGDAASNITTTGTNAGVHLGSSLNNLITFNVADATGDSNPDLTVAAPLINRNTGQGGGAGGLIKTGAGTMRLTSANTYTGNTTVEEGTLILDQAFLADTADVKLTTGATLQLDFADTDTIDELIIDGSPRATGTWGRTGHPTAQHTTSLITGDGLLLVTTGPPPAGYAGWAEGFLPAFTNTAADLDFENDGLASGIEWVGGGNPTLNDAAAVAPTFDNTTDTNNFLFTFRRRDEAAADLKTAIVVEYGSDLVGWTPAEDGVAGVSINATTDLGGGFHQVTVAIPRTLAGGTGKLFARLTVTVTL